MKKAISLMLVAFLAISAPVYAKTESGLPDIGKKLSGFTVTERGHVELLGAETVLFEHDGTGGQVLYIATDDKERSFDISFRTPKLDSKGIPHVFEHICVSGSEKYPFQNLFFLLRSQTYNTFANAMTSNCMTTYPLASLSEDQLIKLADYYLDGVFNPMVYTEEKLYRREAWRYELTEADAPLAITGTVYNEMKGAQTIQTAAYFNMLDSLFPGSTIADISGGNPIHIPEMTWQELTDFHATYYHPSNALVILYGDLDYERFLKLIDEDYYSKYEKAEITIESPHVPSFKKPVDNSYSFPVEISSQIDKASIVSYAGVANGATLEDNIGLALLMAILTHESSPMMQKIREELPGSNISGECSYFNAPVTYYSLNGDGLNAEDKETFNRIIDDSIAEMAEEGINWDIIDAVLAQERFSNLTIPENPNLGVNISYTVAISWAIYDSLEYLNDYIEALDAITEKAEDGYFEELIEKYMLGNNHKAILITSPVPGLAEENAAALTAELEEIKAAMTDDEIDELVQATAELANWSMEEVPAELIESLQAVTIDSLPEETKSYEITESPYGLTVEAAVADIGQTVVYANIGDVPHDYLHYIKLYSALIGNTRTEHYTLPELKTLITRYLYGFSTNAGMIDMVVGDSFIPSLNVSWMSLNEDYETCIELVAELLYATDITDIDNIKGVVGRLKNSMRSEINSTPYIHQYTRALASVYEKYAYSNYLSGLDYYKFLIDTEALLETDPESVIESLQIAVDAISQDAEQVAIFAGNSQGVEIFNNSIGTLLHETDSDIVNQTTNPYDFELLSNQAEALIIDSSVQYNLIYAPLKALGLDNSGKLRPLSLMIYDAYITPQIRHGIGAYDNIVQFTEIGLLFISYHDPSITETYAVYEGLSDFVENSGLTQDDADRYILSAYSAYATPEGELSGAIGAMSRRICGYPDDYILATMREIKSFTIEDFVETAAAFEKLSNEGYRSTAGGADIIQRHGDLFERVVDISALTSGASGQSLTLAELAELLFGAPNSFELAVTYGVFSGVGFEGLEGDSPATREQLAVALMNAGLPQTETEEEVADAGDISEWAVVAVDTVLGLGVIQLDADGNFNPKAEVTEADFYTVMANIMAMSVEE